MLDPETIIALQGFAYGMAQNLIASVIAEGKKLGDDKRALDDVALLEKVEYSKPLEIRIAQRICQTLQDLRFSKEEFNLLLPLASDSVFTTELSKQILSDRYSAESVAMLILAHSQSLEPRQIEVRRLASLLVGAIQSAVADDSHLHRAKELHFQARVTEEIADLHGEVTAVGAETVEALNRMPREMELLVKNAMRSAMAEGFPGAEQLKSTNQKRFDRAREELVAGSIVVAEKSYRELIADLESQGSITEPTLLFRSYTNLGSSLWQQFRRDEAVVWFEKAFQVKPDEPKAKINKALCLIQQREFETALGILGEARAANSNNFEAVYLIASVYSEQRNIAKAISTLNERSYETADYFVALAQAYVSQEDYPKATEAARTALDMEKESPDALIVLANSIGFPLVRRRMRREATAFSLTEIERQQAREAIEACETAAKILEAEDRFFQLGELLTNMSAFYELVDDDIRATQAAKEATKFAPNDTTAIANLWASQMRLGKYDDAYCTAGLLMKHGERSGGKLRQLESLLIDSQSERVLTECENDTELVLCLQKEQKFYEIKARAHFEAHQTDQAFGVIDSGIARFPDDARLYACRASFYEEIGQLDAARQNIKLSEQATSGDKLRSLLEVAMFYYRHSEWADAKERLLKLGSDSIHSPFLTRYLTCLYNLREYPQCFTLATKAIAITASFDETLHELGARCAYSSNDLPAAIKFLDKLVSHNTKNVVDHQKMLAEVYLRLDEPEKAFNVLKKAQARKDNDVDVLIGLSFAAPLLKRYKEGVNYGVAAVKAAPKNARAHMALVKAALDSPLAAKVDNKHRKFFQRSLEFLNKHPAGYIKAVPIEKNLKSFIAMVKARAVHAQKTEDLVRERNLPMAFLAQQLGLSPFQTWLGLIAHSNLHVQMAFGTTEEQTRELESARTTKVVWVDVFSLLTLRLLKRLDLLPKLFSKVYVHTAILEALLEDIREMETKRTGCSISYLGGKLIRSEISDEQFEQRLSFLKDIRDFLKGSAVELVGFDASKLPEGDTKKVHEILGAIYYEPILAAKVGGAAYYGDDAPMRSLAWNSHTVQALCTQALLRSAKEQRLVTDTDYQNCLVTLLRHNYYFVSESAETLARLVESEGFLFSDLSKQMVQRIANPKVDQNTSIRILSEFCLYLWRADYSRTTAHRGAWIELCIDGLLLANQPEKLFGQFVSNLGVRAVAHPEAFAGITHWILRSGKLSAAQQAFFYVTVQQVIIQMAKLANQEFPWWLALGQQWWDLGRLNVTLDHNRWI